MEIFLNVFTELAGKKDSDLSPFVQETVMLSQRQQYTRERQELSKSTFHASVVY